MKTNFLIKLTVVVALFTFCNINVFAKNQHRADSHRNQNLIMCFLCTDTVLIVVPDDSEVTQQDNSIVENYFKSEKKHPIPVCIYKNESEVTVRDRRKHILYMGSIYQFKKNIIAGAQIKKIENGFKIHDRIFKNPNDGFYFVNKNATRMYICENSNQLNTEIFSQGFGKYPFHVFSENKIVLTGIYF